MDDAAVAAALATLDIGLTASGAGAPDTPDAAAAWARHGGGEGAREHGWL